MAVRIEIIYKDKEYKQERVVKNFFGEDHKNIWIKNNATYVIKIEYVYMY